MGAKITDDLLGMDPPNIPDPPAPPPPPNREEVEAQRLAKEAADTERVRGSKGRASLFTNGQRGVTEKPSLSKKVLLGS